MNLEEAIANIGKEVTYIGNDKELIDDVFKDKKLIIYELTKRMATNVLIEHDELCFWNIDPRHLKLKEQPMQNYKIKVTPETSAEVQELFFALGNSFTAPTNYDVNSYLFIFSYSCGKLTHSNDVSNFNNSENQEITLPQLRDLVVLKRNDVGDATHAGKNGQKYYISENCAKEYVYGKWVDKVSRVMPIPLSELHVMGCGNKEITWQDAEQAIKDGKDVQVFVCEWSDIGDVFKNHKFRLAPQRITLNGKFTKEELLKIMGEME